MKNLKCWAPVMMGLAMVVAAGVMMVRSVEAMSVLDGTVMADEVQTTILPESWASEDGLGEITKFILNLVVYGLGAAAVLGTVIAGIMYMTARDSEAQVAAAKKRLLEVVIGLAAWAVMFVALNWLIPGGLNMSSSDPATPVNPAPGSPVTPVSPETPVAPQPGEGELIDPGEAEDPDGCENGERICVF